MKILCCRRQHRRVLSLLLLLLRSSKAAANAAISAKQLFLDPRRLRQLRNSSSSDGRQQQLARRHRSDRPTSSTATSATSLAFLPSSTYTAKTSFPQRRPSSMTPLNLKFRTFEEMLSHHHTTPLLIDFYSPYCGPCKLMKGTISSIRDVLDTLGPNVIDDSEDSEEGEDCSVVEDVIALSTQCLDKDGDENYETAVTTGVGIASSLLLKAKRNDGVTSSSSLSDEDITTAVTSPPLTTAYDDNNNNRQEQRPSGIPVYHVNTLKFPQVGAKNHIAGLPTLVLFYQGRELWRNEGMISGEEIVNVLCRLQEDGWTMKPMDHNEKVNEKEITIKSEEKEYEDDDNEEGNDYDDDDDVSKIDDKATMVTAPSSGREEVGTNKKRKGRRLGG